MEWSQIKSSEMEIMERNHNRRKEYYVIRIFANRVQARLNEIDGIKIGSSAFCLVLSFYFAAVPSVHTCSASTSATLTSFYSFHSQDFCRCFDDDSEKSH